MMSEAVDSPLDPNARAAELAKNPQGATVDQQVRALTGSDALTQEFYAVAGQVLITIDKHDHQGRLLAMDAHGMVRSLVRGLTYGLNPIAPILARAPSGTGAVAPGLYVADWRSHDVLVVPAATLRPFAGSVIVGTERRGLIYLVQPQGAAYRLWTLVTNLHGPDYNLEGARYIAG